jgi:hypothetical protein
MNNITFETFKMALILLPGFTWSLIWMKYSKNKPQTDKFYFVVYAIVTSAFNYLATYFTISIFIEDFDKYIIEILDSDINENDITIISITTVISLISASLSVYLSHKTPILNLMRYLEISPKRESENNVLTSTIIEHMKLKEYALIRIYNFDNNRIYQGLITKISEPKQQMEFLILNCDIYDNNTGKFLLSMKGLYLNIDSNNLLIEFIKYERRR